MSLVAAIGPTSVLSFQLIEGTFDSSLFANYVHRTVDALQHSEDYQGKELRIILFMDNAGLHQHRMVHDSLRALGAHVVYNAQYSPWLNPIE